MRPMHQLFAAPGVTLEFFAAPYGDQVRGPAHNLVLFQKFVNRWEVVRRFLRDERVDLDGEAEVRRVADGVDGPLIAAVLPAHSLQAA